MPPTPDWSKSFVATYIYKNHKQQSRYEIDLTLLQSGHSPEEIEAAWQLLNPAPVRPIPISFLWLDFLLLFGSLLLGAFSLFFPGFWPFVNFISIIYSIISLISFVALIAILFGRKTKKRVGFKENILFFITKCLLGLIFIGAFLIRNPTLNQGTFYQEIATTSVQGNDHHLLYSGGCLETCAYQVTLYRCSFFNLICPEIDSGLVTYSRNPSYPPATSDPKIIYLKIEGDTRKVLLMEGDRVVHIFKNV